MITNQHNTVTFVLRDHLHWSANNVPAGLDQHSRLTSVQLKSDEDITVDTGLGGRGMANNLVCRRLTCVCREIRPLTSSVKGLGLGEKTDVDVGSN